MDTNRLEAFSDGVFAIAITLLVLEIKVPPPGTAFGMELFRLWPSYLAYVVSFLVIGAIWINHHAMFRHIVRVDDTLLLLNVLHLMLIAFLPFPTAVIAQAFHRGTDEPAAAAFYGGTDRDRPLRQRDVAVRGTWTSTARRPRHGERGAAGRTATPRRAGRLCGRHRDRAGRAEAGAAAVSPPQSFLSLAAPGSRERFNR